MARLWSPDGAAVRSEADLEAASAWLKAFVSARGVSVACNGYFRTANAALTRYLRWRTDGLGFRDVTDQIRCIREVHAYMRVSRALRRAFDSRSVPGLDAKVAELRDQPFGLQSATASNHSRNTIWELFVGAVFVHVDPGLRFEEPDIRVRHGGIDWGVACKLVTSRNVARHRDRLRDAAEQIESSGADFGLAWVNVTALIDHAALLAPHPDGGARMWASAGSAAAALCEQVVGLERQWDEARLRERMGQGRDAVAFRRIRGAALFAESVMGVSGRLDDQSRTQFYGNRPLPVLEENLVVAFNEALGEAT